jgi:hypothetical protein
MSEIKKRLQTFYKDFTCDVIAEPKFYFMILLLLLDSETADLRCK